MRLCLCSALLVSALPAPVAAAQPATFDLQAHRGGRSAAAEGSLRAFANALELGVSTLELDIGITRDGQPVVWHDATIGADRCADTAAVIAGDPQYPYVGKRVHDLSLAQLGTLDCGDPIATLPEVFALADEYRASAGDGVRFNIETKVDAENPGGSADPQQFVDVILAAVRASGKTGSVEIQSFDWRTLPLVRRAEPAIPLVALWDQRTWVPDSPWLAGINPAVVDDPITAAGTVGANILAPQHTLVDRAFVQRAHAVGFKVIPWTVNDEQTMRAQIAMGVDGIITDQPGLARDVMSQLGMPLPPAYRRG